MNKEQLFIQILDDSNQMIQISHLETYEMIYANLPAKKHAEQMKQPSEGAHCYNTMMGFKEPCPFCPLRHSDLMQTNETEFDNGEEILKIKIKPIEWNGEKAFVEYVWDISEKKRMEQASYVEREKLQEKKLQENLLINAALGQDYTGIFLIDCNDGSIKVVKLDKAMNAANLDPNLSFDMFREFYLQNYVLEENKEKVAEISKLKHLIQYFNEGHKNLTLRYKVKANKLGQENFEIYMVPFLEGKGHQIIFATRCIDDIITKEEEKNIELMQQLRIIDGLTNAYFACYRAELDTGDFVAIKQAKSVADLLKNCSNFEEAFEAFIPVGIEAEDQEKMKIFTDRRTLQERLRYRDSLTTEYHGKMVAQWCRATWVVASRDNKGDAVSVIYVVEEITESVLERKLHEKELASARNQAEAANRAKTTFLFNMSHDIRTPMNAIIGFTDLLKKYKDDPNKIDNYIQKIESSSRFLLSLINNVLEMARIESGNTQTHESTCSAVNFNDMLFSVFEEQMKTKHIKFLKKADIKHDYVLCDTVKLRKIFLNILSNAYKYTPEGGTVSMELKELDSEKKGYALFETTISDTGIGMSQEFLPVLFEEFTRENNSIDSNIEGTGLGMPIVKRMVDDLGGTIEVKSERGKGTTFIIRIHHKISDQSSFEEHPEKEIHTDRFIGKRILLAEDNDLNAEIAIEILSDVGFLLERAADGRICLDMLNQSDDFYYDLILMDIQMPNIDGYQATQMIRKMENSYYHNIPIIAMTANAFEEDKKNALDVGMNGHIAKPFRVQELMEKLDVMLA